MPWLDALLERPPVTWWDLLDIAIVAIVVYEVLKLIRGTRASQMAVALGAIDSAIPSRESARWMAAFTEWRVSK